MRWIGGALILSCIAAGIYLRCIRERAIEESAPPAAVLAERLLGVVLGGDFSRGEAEGESFFSGESSDAALLPLLRGAMDSFWKEAGQTQISEGPLFESNRYKPQWSAQAYVRRVSCVHKAGRRQSVLFLDYQPATGKFIPIVWLDGRPLEASGARAPALAH